MRPASVTPSDFGLISGESTVHVVNGVNAGNPVYGGELTPTDSSGFPDSDLDGSATTPDGRTILYASGGGNVSVCLNVQSGNPDCFKHSVEGGYSDVDTVGITSDGAFGIVNDDPNLARINFDSAGNPTVGEDITLTTTGGVSALVIAPVATAPGKYRVLVEFDNGDVRVLQNVGQTGGPGVGYTEGALLTGQPSEDERHHVAVVQRRLLSLDLRLYLVVARKQALTMVTTEEPFELITDPAVPVDQRSIAV